LPDTPYAIFENDVQCAVIWADDVDEALSEAINEIDLSLYESEEHTEWVDVGVRSLIDNADHKSTTIEIEVPEPDCTDDDGHGWQSPLSVVGGIEDNPGVWGNGGGVIIREVCAHCGMYRCTDTWAQNPSTGEQGLKSVSYADADEESLQWIASLSADGANRWPPGQQRANGPGM